jgi:taurine dioxygenase
MLEGQARHAEVPSRDLRYETFEIKTLTPHIGAELRGLDLSQPLPDEQHKELRRAFQDWMVLVFPDQHLTRDQHKALARQFGRLHTHPMRRQKSNESSPDSLAGSTPDSSSRFDPEILPVKTTADSAYTAGDGWHTDVTCDEIPPLGSMLYITETPESGGGDTLFADMCLAYELLSETMRGFLSGLTAVHDGAIPYVGSYKSTPPKGGYPRSEHPVVTRHPDSGRKVLYVNAGFTSHIVGLSRAESRALLDLLFRHIDSTPRLYCRVQWRPNTLTFWDNRCTQHHAVWDYHPHSRTGERVSVLGDERPRA